MNGERRVQRVRRAVAPPEGRAHGLGDHVRRRPRHGPGRRASRIRRAEAIWDEIRAVWPAGAGHDLRAARPGRPAVALPDRGSPGHRRCCTSTASRTGRGPRCAASSREPSPRSRAAEYPFVLVTGRHLYQFNAGTMTGRTGNAVLRPQDVLEMSPADAARLSLAEGDVVEIESRHGQARLPVHVDSAIQAGQLFATFHSPGDIPQPRDRSGKATRSRTRPNTNGPRCGSRRLPRHLREQQRQREKAEPHRDGLRRTCAFDPMRGSICTCPTVPGHGSGGPTFAIIGCESERWRA